MLTYRLGKDCHQIYIWKGLISKNYKQLKKISTNNPNNPMKKKWHTELNREFLTEESQMAEALKEMNKVLSHQGNANSKQLWQCILYPAWEFSFMQGNDLMAKIKNSSESSWWGGCGIRCNQVELKVLVVVIVLLPQHPKAGISDMSHHDQIIIINLSWVPIDIIIINYTIIQLILFL